MLIDFTKHNEMQKHFWILLLRVKRLEENTSKFFFENRLYQLIETGEKMYKDSGGKQYKKGDSFSQYFIGRSV